MRLHATPPINVKFLGLGPEVNGSELREEEERKFYNTVSACNGYPPYIALSNGMGLATAVIRRPAHGEANLNARDDEIIIEFPLCIHMRD
ncbi:hypothetical protein HHX47_DHR1000349 [Lentinula edodes]|nr:hypothetical protein HHX47_DHR1000349 [Lentinula edodes]